MEKSLYITSEDGNEVPRTDLAIEAFSYSYDPVKQLETKIAQQKCDFAVQKCVAKWDDRRKAIYRMLEQGTGKSTIAKKLGVHPSTITYFTQSMEKDMETYL
jgi:DNA-binding NarL/FixJ family response regulator